MAEHEVRIQTRDGSMSTFIAHPEGGGAAPVVVVLQDAIGIREVLRDVARRLASNGYYAALPDLYYRWGDKISFDPRKLRSDPDVRARIVEMSERQSDSEVMSDTQALLRHVASDGAASPGPKGCLGFCMGGRHVVRALAAFPDEFVAGSSLHPSFLVTDQADSPHLGIGTIRGELYLGYGEDDQTHPTATTMPPMRDELDRHGITYSLDVYPAAGHGYMLAGNVGYQEAAAEASWARTLDLFRRAIPVPAGQRMTDGGA